RAGAAAEAEEVQTLAGAEALHRKAGWKPQAFGHPDGSRPRRAASAAQRAGPSRRVREQVSRLCFEGPEEELTLTRNTQPALLVTSVAIFRLLEAHGFAPDLGAGHSLGEYSALVAAGAMSFADAVRTVRLRGELMEEAVPPGEGTMAAILGLERDLVEALCQEVAGVVEPATYNSPGQVVVAGETEAVHALMERALAKGARRAQLLKVSGPFHSSLLAGAGERLGEWLASIPIAPPRFPVYSNVTAAPVTTPEEIRACLARQVSAPVRWEESVRNMVA